ncbi:hypothetical protein KPH14_007645 [Odynerus spinipes]|uniref:Tesmin/TSO1-like CXC domain-containing protein n=1 Tax=Odynerus spinipes TaxID=1348599 RepID=A0AAD9VN56_9HYME|nr:hypothetical protein KPH14_007645 [Odynerus spinipes]
MWLEYEKNATEWGWMKTNRGLEPLVTTADPAPESLLKTISCRCKKNCGKMCGCRKAGLKCSILCQKCSGETCENTVKIRELLDDDDDFDCREHNIDNPAESKHNIDTPEDENLEISEDETEDVNLAGPSSKRKKTT